MPYPALSSSMRTGDCYIGISRLQLVQAVCDPPVSRLQLKPTATSARVIFSPWSPAEQTELRQAYAYRGSGCSSGLSVQLLGPSRACSLTLASRVHRTAPSRHIARTRFAGLRLRLRVPHRATGCRSSRRPTNAWPSSPLVYAALSLSPWGVVGSLSRGLTGRTHGFLACRHRA